jgi:DNA-binding winged helix-turn-helix (wHTH) protein
MIRRKPPRSIQTIPKAGYRLVAEVHPVPSEPAGLPASPEDAPLASPAATSNGGGVPPQTTASSGFSPALLWSGILLFAMMAAVLI